MSTTERHLHYSYQEYLALEDESLVRHEFLDGEIYAMAGGTPDHAALAAALIGILRAQLPPSCRTFTSDLRIRIATTGLTTYPDASVICGKSERAPEDRIAVVNPVLLVEVTSPSTEEYDRGAKLEHYRTLASVQEVAIVSHSAPWVTIHRRDGRVWTMLEGRSGQTIELRSVPVRLSVDELYQGGLEDAS